MDRINNRYAKDYVQKTFVDSLEEDGALCDYYSKYYLEEETLKGGIGNRLAFKNYNDRISQFHNILKILTGERRANIYEALPAIDFMKPSNTSFLNTYPLTEKGINPKEIIAISASVGENPLQIGLWLGYLLRNISIILRICFLLNIIYRFLLIKEYVIIYTKV